ncbi:alanine racemase [uncultured Oscillibacter sp.]|uniref:alanine racemase n=1 Tax=uncultured Oscillibacter sp. TaxID=876091 RepID=UPI0025F2E650|nr:alanine racemase [uncultured Oscillibacter sp.]
MMTLETPYIVIDMDKVHNNLRRMAEHCAANRCRLRPHTKTHKIPELAKLQLEYGAAGITVAKLSEAEVMAEHGIDDIFMAYPLVGEGRIRRAIALARKIRLICAADCYETAEAISRACAAEGVVLELRLEVDTGMHRTGIPYDDAVAEAVRLSALPGIRLQGIFTFRGLICDGKTDADRKKCGHQEGALMADLAERIRAAGVPLEDVSVGSTPTGEFCAEVPGVTEVRPGTYIFQDMMQVNTQACGSTQEDVAAVVVSQVVSTCKPEVVVIDCGCKSLSTDTGPGKAPYFLKGYGTVVGHPELVLSRLSEEHGMLEPEGPCTVHTGDLLEIIPNHICPTVNLFDRVYLKKDGAIYGTYEVKARGKNY